MTTTQPLDTNAPLTLAPITAASTETVEIVRAESELAAIDEMMAELSDDWVTDAKAIGGENYYPRFRP